MSKIDANETMAKVVEMIKAEDFQLSDLVYRKLFLTAKDAPSRKWSWLNQAAMAQNNTGDARTFAQWIAVKRHVKKGAKAFYIWAPNLKTVKETKEGRTEEKQKMYGFRPVCVFRYEDTEGEPLPEYEMELANLPLIGLSKEMGISVKSAPTSGNYAGYFNPAAAEIVLCTDDPSTWLHELSHAIDKKLCAEFNKDYAAGELVAETSAAVLLALFGLPNDIRTHSDYVRHYAEKDFLKAFNAVMGRIQAVVEFVVEYQEAKAEATA